MAVVVWSDREGVLGSTIRSGRRVSLSPEEYRAEAEELDEQLDAVLDMAWHALTLITRRENGKARLNSFEQVWVLGRAVHISEILRHEALQGEARALLWQALTAKAWYGIRHDRQREPRLRELIPSNRKNGKRNLRKTDPTTFSKLAIGCAISSCMTPARSSAGNSTTPENCTFAHLCAPLSCGERCCIGCDDNHQKYAKFSLKPPEENLALSSSPRRCKSAFRREVPVQRFCRSTIRRMNCALLSAKRWTPRAKRISRMRQNTLPRANNERIIMTRSLRFSFANGAMPPV